MEFPQFRKLENGKSLYKISAPKQFVELQQIGSHWVAYSFEVHQFPDLLRVQDMLAAKPPYLKIEEAFFQSIYSRI